MKAFKKLSRYTLIVTLLSSISTTSFASQKKEEVLGSINNIPIQNSQLSPKEKDMMFQAQSKLYETAQKILEQHYLNKWYENYRIQNHLASITDARQLYFSKNVHISDKDVKQFIEHYQSEDELQKIPEKERPEVVRKYLEQVAQVDSEKKIVEQAHQQNKIKLIAYSKPKQEGFEFKVTGHVYNPSLKSPKITLVEFADYQCPYCLKADPEILKFVTTYPSSVQYIYMDLPLVNIHPQAMPSAIATYCAQEQNQYWPMHHLLMNRHDDTKLNPGLYESYAKQLNLDMNKFSECQKNPVTTKPIEAMMEEAHRVGVQGTPTLYFNGIKYDRSMSYEEMKNFADKLVN